MPEHAARPGRVIARGVGLIAACVLLAPAAMPSTALGGHAVARTVQVAGHPVRISTHPDVIRSPDTPIASLDLRDRFAPGPSRAARASGLAALPTRWCGSERSTDDTVHELTDAPRVKVVYAYAAGSPNRSQLLRDLIQQDVSTVRSALAAASHGRRTIRFDMGTDCPGGARYVDIATVALPHDAGHYGLQAENASASIWSDLRRALRLRGRWNVTAYVDGVTPGQTEGIASQPLDESPGRSNDANRGGQRAFVFGDGSPQFGPARTQAFVHETLHALGAVQDGAPHASGLGHCFDWADVMCYDDGGPTAPRPWPAAACPGALRIDCGGDDYFAARPPRGSYLARRWNLYDSAFMCALRRCDAPSAEASARVALTTTLVDLTRRLRQAGLPGLLRRGALRVVFRAPRAGRVALTVAAGARKLIVGRRAVRRAGRTTIVARRRPPARRLARAARLRIEVRLSFRSARHGRVTRKATFLVRRP